MRIFESFILDGEVALLRVLYRMIELKQEKILQMEEIDLIMYLRTDIINEVIAEEGIEALLDDSHDNLEPPVTPRGPEEEHKI